MLQLLLTFDPVLVEKVSTLLYHVMQDNPVLPRLYLTGVFFFVMMYTGSNVLPVARFLKYTHLKQAFRSDEVSRLKSIIYDGESLENCVLFMSQMFNTRV